MHALLRPPQHLHTRLPSHPSSCVPFCAGRQPACAGGPGGGDAGVGALEQQERAWWWLATSSWSDAINQSQRKPSTPLAIVGRAGREWGTWGLNKTVSVIENQLKTPIFWRAMTRQQCAASPSPAVSRRVSPGPAASRAFGTGGVSTSKQHPHSTHTAGTASRQPPAAARPSLVSSDWPLAQCSVAGDLCPVESVVLCHTCTHINTRSTRERHGRSASINVCDCARCALGACAVHDSGSLASVRCTGCTLSSCHPENSCK
jgi:hypothetical protein